MEQGEKVFEKNPESRSAKKKKFRERDRSGGKETSDENGGQEIYSKSVLLYEFFVCNRLTFF